MDLVSRLKRYIDFRHIGSTQFADLCSIPRPTVSQLLNGRNKKVSDEIITKIHDAFPDLSILWLMFGEGEMVARSNNSLSMAENGDFKAITDNYIAENEQYDSASNPQKNVNDFEPEKFSIDFYDRKQSNTGSDPHKSNISSPTQPISQPADYISINFSNHDLNNNSTGDKKNSHSIGANSTVKTNSDENQTLETAKTTINQTGETSKKRIINIVVLYDDSTFETFKPS